MRIKQAPLALMLLPLLAATAHADQWADIQAKQSISCGVYSDVPPFASPNPQSRALEGMDVDLCTALAKHLGVKLELKPLSGEARVPEVKMGRVDVVIANLAYTKTRAQQIQYSDPYYVAKEVLVVKAPLADKPRSYFAGKRISATKGSTSEQSIRLADAVPVTFQDTGSAYLAVQQNKVLGVVTNTMSAKKLVSQAKAGGVDLGIVAEPMALEPVGVGMKLEEPALLAKVNDALYAMDKAGEIDQIWSKWIGPATEYNMVREERVQKLADMQFQALE
ncbi:transporter substrate-binding domain-containing protein [Pseudomonas sp. 21LCFQ02]|uniref:transporter substrate-binding domain-containing protein n=1 Tax=unclassified Pseudomonas TaxID=196821 RepID=UPI0004F58619|nr:MULTISPECIES: transporter substrate-binding domain-containing protein [unclassified Pseudomonas]MCO8164361.1 transporter substrate-binding domain-containing protein [Pseudomonas sp. 21LCFQ010]MCO8170917.1 transporter substrate-binding domain-containing protein [Pseudomonas sp. 21LCFQ02]MCQ9427240.1 transporter substrate-binding domain-containing protein [Pseudomonas sp. LJDD11]BAP45686.1 glutamine ABC transporter, periplasmic amino acid-binding protein [Pseudomonas sp. StFLB209]